MEQQIPIDKIYQNINMDYGIGEENQKRLFNGNAQFLIDL